MNSQLNIKRNFKQNISILKRFKETLRKQQLYLNFFSNGNYVAQIMGLHVVSSQNCNNLRQYQNTHTACLSP